MPWTQLIMHKFLLQISGSFWQKNNMSIRQLAEKIGIAATTLNDSLKSKKGVSVDSLIKIADYFNLTVTTFAMFHLTEISTGWRGVWYNLQQIQKAWFSWKRTCCNDNWQRAWKTSEALKYLWRRLTEPFFIMTVRLLFSVLLSYPKIFPLSLIPLSNILHIKIHYLNMCNFVCSK